MGLDTEEISKFGPKGIAISAISKYFSISSDHFSKAYQVYPDLKSMFSNLLESSEEQRTFNVSSENREEVLRWLTFADDFHADTRPVLNKFKDFDENLIQRSVLGGTGLCPSIADIVVFAYLHDSMLQLPQSEWKAFPNILRWFDYIQNKVDFAPDFEKIRFEKSKFIPLEFQGGDKSSHIRNAANDKVPNADSKKKDQKARKGEGETKKEAEQKKKSGEVDSAGPKSGEDTVAALNIRVGLIQRACKHPSADSLLVEEIDVGEEKVRQVVSGLAKYFSPDALLNRKVLVVTNVKPGKLRDVMSAGLVLCASNKDHTVVEPLLPPEGAKIGEQVTFSGYEGKPEEALNPKKKQLEKISANFDTDADGVAMYKGVPFMTSAGPCRASLPNASIK